MKVLVVGSGGREHSICWKLSQSPKVTALYCAPGNGGIAQIARCVDVKATDVGGMVKWAKENAMDFVMVAPDDPLALGMVDALEAAGIGYVKTAVGDKYVYEDMVKNGRRIGGEQSGHIIFSKYARTGDGILTALKVMEVMMAKKETLSRLAEPVTIYPQVLINVRVKDKRAAQDDRLVRAAVDAVAAELGDTGRILVRESGTEPLVRVMVEAPEKGQCQELAQSVVDVIIAQGHKAD